MSTGQNPVIELGAITQRAVFDLSSNAGPLLNSSTSSSRKLPMRTPPMNPDLCFYSFRFVFCWNEYARTSCSEVLGINFSPVSFPEHSVFLLPTMSQESPTPPASRGNFFFYLSAFSFSPVPRPSMSGIEPHIVPFWYQAYAKFIKIALGLINEIASFSSR